MQKQTLIKKNEYGEIVNLKELARALHQHTLQIQWQGKKWFSIDDYLKNFSTTEIDDDIPALECSQCGGLYTSGGTSFIRSSWDTIQCYNICNC